MNNASACDYEAKGRKDWLYDEYCFRRRDDDGRRSGDADNNWTGAQSIEWYRGEFTRDAMNGYGDYRWRQHGPKGASVTYEGYFFANKLHGYGTMSYPDGRTFSGLYYKDMRWGPGVQYLDMHQDVGYWQRNQLVRLAWRPKTYPIAPDLPSGENGKVFVEQFRTLLVKDTRVIGKTNSAIDLLKECGMDPMEASKHWSKLYAKNCTDLHSPACDVNAFENPYYKGKVHLLRPLASGENCRELAENKRLYYAWNNNKLIIHMMRHCFKHNYQRSEVRVDLETILNGSRNKFHTPGPYERNARTMLMCCYLGRILDVVKYINESGIYPDLTDNLGNSALVYATCGEQVDLIHFRVEAGANVNSMNDSCCTPLSIALMRYACSRQEVPFNKITQVVLPRPTPISELSMDILSTKLLKTLKLTVEDSPEGLDWIIRRIITLPTRPSLQTRRSTILRPVSKATVDRATPTRNISRKAISLSNSLTSLSEPNLPRTKTSISFSRQKAKQDALNMALYDSDDSISEDNLFYKVVTHEFLIKLNKVYQSGASHSEYLFGVNNMTRSLDKEQEDEDFSTPLTHNDVNMMWQCGSKTALDSLSFIPDRAPQMMLTIMQLVSDGADPELVRCPQPAMLIAVAAGCPDLLRYLVSHGVDVNETFPAALHYNALEIVMARPLSLENILLMKALMESGADVNHRIHYRKGLGPTLMHVLLAKETSKQEEEDLLETTLNLLIKHKFNPFTLFKGNSPIELVMKKRLHLLELFIKSPSINLNEAINNDNQTILVKMLSVPFFEYYHFRLDLSPLMTELLLRGADPLISCQFQGNTYENIFAFIKCNVEAFKSDDRRTSKQIGQGDAKMTRAKKKDFSKKKESLKMPTVMDDYRTMVDLLSSCVRMMHVKWLQAKLVQELVAVVYKHKHRWWHLIIKEHKNQKATAIWVTPQRFIEIWDILKTTKKKLYTDDLVLKSTLCILQLYQKRKVSFPMNLTVSVTVRDEIQSDVCKMMTEHKFVALKAEDVQKALQNTDVYIKAELKSKNTDKYNICFECCIPLQKEQGILCSVCHSVLFCSTDCVETNGTRFNCHLCNELKGRLLRIKSNKSINSKAVSDF